ncbi:CMRF35-like molecule 1 isoform X2 [Ornithorhynchus anatinus]|uniref:CMRF35-like molecule 1 isoform X2 n=1 Tax=Ornithorhynchus anatinus TaxID=9258 RepID=UPI0010A90903|nr:CMRF35-like molecule 1 isoform X2 [Ornithorhynchus anatinus]
MKLQVALLLLWFLCCIPERSAKDLRGSGTVTGLVGGSLTVWCRYQEGWESSEKYWCRGKVWESCTIIISTSKSGGERRNGRVSIKDNHQGHIFTVTMDRLQEGDAGIYWCGMKSIWLDPKHLVNVTISPVTGRSATTLKLQGLKPSNSALSHTDLLTDQRTPTTPIADPYGDKVTSALPSLLPSACEEMEYVTMVSFRREDVPGAPGSTSDQAPIYGNVGPLTHFAHPRNAAGEAEYTFVRKG